MVKLLAVVELSMPMIELGVFASVAAGLRSAFESHQFEAQVRVGVVFYSDQGVGFLRPGPPGSDPAVFLVTNNKSGIFCSPLSDEEYLLDPNSQREQLLGLVDFLEKYADSAWKQGRFNHTANYVNALRCIRDSFEQETGRVLLFSLLDPRSGPCCIRPRTEEESKSALKPMHLESQELGRELQRARIGVEHFVFSKDGLVSH